MADSKIKRTRSFISHKAWNLVRMALLWGRKGGVFKRWPILFQLRNLFCKQLKTLIHHHRNGNDRYLSRQLSFDETPLFNVKKKKMHRPNTTSSMRFLLLPCIASSSSVDFEYDFETDGRDYSDEVRSYGYGEEEEEKGVDVRAEEFIAKFYEQIKLQRQISYLEYKEHNDVVSL